MPRHLDRLPESDRSPCVLPPIPRYQFTLTPAEALRAEILTPHDARSLLETMTTIRAFEETLVELRSGIFVPVPGFRYVGATHTSIGQEATAGGALAALGPEDRLTSTHRGHGHTVAHGLRLIQAMTDAGLEAFVEDVDWQRDLGLVERATRWHLFKMFAELLGREPGYCRGRGGSMHIADVQRGHLGANAIVGGSSAIAVGAALGLSLRGSEAVVACFLGDGALANGVTLEALNFAAQAQFARGVPVIFLIENNQYAESAQSIGEVTGVSTLARRGAGFADNNMHAEIVDGMNVLAVRDAVQRARALCLAGQGPVLLDLETYRFLGHSLSDAGTRYRSEAEVAAWKQRDPVKTFAAQLASAGVLPSDEIAGVDRQVRERVRWAATEAAKAPEPDPATILEGLYAATSSEGIGGDLRTVQYDRPRAAASVRAAPEAIPQRRAIAEALGEEMLRDRRVLLYGQDVADYGGSFQVTPGLLEVFGRQRVFNAPISEAAIVGTAVGLALVGMRPVAEIMYIDFILQAMDQVANQAAKVRYMFGSRATVPLVIRTAVGGGKGYAGQHSQSLEALVAHFPGLLVAAPSTAYDAKGLLKTAIRTDNPVIFIEHQLLYAEKDPVPADEYTLPFGEAVIRRPGRDVTIVAYSYMAKVALAAAERLRALGIDAEVIDPRTLVPLDADTIAASVARTGRLLVLSQAPARGSFAEHIAFQVQSRCLGALRAPIAIEAAAPVPPPMARTLEAAGLPSAESVVRAAHRLCAASPREPE
jgi:2-oxoisovalerate dehydrogenase E1 component